jgi:hypothetical protein
MRGRPFDPLVEFQCPSRDYYNNLRLKTIPLENLKLWRAQARLGYNPAMTGILPESRRFVPSVETIGYSRALILKNS